VRDEGRNGWPAQVRRGHERFEIACAVASRRDDASIDQFLTCESRFAHRDPDGGMPPEHRPHEFLGKQPQPVPPRHVMQFVRDDRLLMRFRRRSERMRNQN
jgi:hypothetical protein